MIEHAITLFSYANAKNYKFGITNKHGNPVWYGKFFNEMSRHLFMACASEISVILAITSFMAVLFFPLLRGNAQATHWPHGENNAARAERDERKMILFY